jgi:hypothetical protein
MALSDPTIGVPTPTGTLQGVAAFSWDGTAWQPAASAGPSVATPTGVLRGVAPFSWDGANWQPAGRPTLDVGTPSGTLEGVAVYTWSGSAWTPAGGQSTPATPSGALRGVAAFTWDGAAWQPAGKAGPSVATPYGVLAGVAMFNWTGSWTAGTASLDLNFMEPGSLDPRITFTRGSTATYFSSAGVMQTAATNAPRWDYDPVTHALCGLLIEEARTNGVAPSVPDTGAHWSLVGPASQGGSITAPDGTTSTTSLIAATDTTNSIRQLAYGSGVGVTASTAYSLTVFLRKSASGNANAYIQCNIAGGATVVPIAYFDLTNGVAVVGADLAPGATGLSASISGVGNGWFRANFSFTTTATNNGVTPYIGPCTTVSATGDNRSAVGVVGQGIYVWGAQLEQGAFPTSYIPTAGTTVTRSGDLCTASIGAWNTPQVGTLQVEAQQQALFSKQSQLVGLDIPGSTRTAVLVAAANTVNAFDTTGAINQSLGAVPVGTPFKAAFAYHAGAQQGALNAALAAALSAASLSTGMTVLAIGCDGSAQQVNGYIRRVRYWPRVLSNAELQAVTT